MRWRKRVRGYQSAMLPGWGDYLRLRPIPFALLTLRRARPTGEDGTLVGAYERAKGYRVERERTERLIRLFRSIQGFDPAAARVLDVGPRTVAEPCLLRLYGFREVVAVDIVPKHPSIRRGNMHALPFPDAAFDVVYCAFTITYGRPPEVLAEFRRVLRPLGLLGLAWGTADPPRVVRTEAGSLVAAPLEPGGVLAAFRPSHVYWADSARWDGGTATHYMLLRR